ncbi:MAG: hypothetical protein M2R45_03727 [Verrucomicrobia subdivision 3 bacterium]|nr:hypothetical protein [Limisphaerales bacterium]MCS1416949.1 hypothetical protein [Limisphaerales bacterium]
MNGCFRGAWRAVFGVRWSFVVIWMEVISKCWVTTFEVAMEITVDFYGNSWQSDNDGDGSYGVRLNNIMEYGNYGYLDEVTGESWRVPWVNAHKNVFSRHWHKNDLGVVSNFIQTGAGSPTGITVYEGELLPRIFHG